MKVLLFALLTCFMFSCQKDAEVSLDNYIEIDGAQYLRRQGSKGKYYSEMQPPYYTAVQWNDGNEQAEIEVSVGNTCTNTRGLLSDFHGFVIFSLRKGQDSVAYYGKFPQFELQNTENKQFISFSHLKLYRIQNKDMRTQNLSDSKTVSGRVTFK